MKLGSVLDFLEVPAGASFDLPPAEALAFFRAKGLKPSFSFADLTANETAAAFSVAKMVDLDLLGDMRNAMDQALAEGLSFQEFADRIVPTLQAKGWWGRKAVLNPLTGETIVSQLGSPSRLRTIFRTNIQQAYNAGRWEQIARQADEAPYLMYDAVDDHRTRPEHKAWDEKVLHVDDKWWNTHYPPNGWNCRCSVIQLDAGDLESLDLKPDRAPKIEFYDWKNPRTGKVEKIPKGLDPGFNYNPGKARVEQLAKTLAEKASVVPADWRAAAAKGITATQRASESAKLAVAVAEAQKALAKAVGAENLARATANAATKAAQTQIDAALASNTPYLAKAIKQLQGKDLTPTELLAKAKVNAAKFEQSQHLTAYKNALLNNKTPSAKAQAAFDALPDEASSALTAQIDQLLAAKAAEKAALAELEQLLGVGTGKQIGAKVLAGLPAEATSAQKLAALKAAIDAQKAKQVAAQGLAGYKKAAIDGKVPTPKQLAAFQALDPQAKAALLEEIDAAKAAAKASQAPPTAVDAPAPAQAQAPAAQAGLDASGWTQVGPQRGSNPGGLYVDPTTGERWYVKLPASLDVARNEILAARLYELAGVAAPELRLVTLNGRTGVASRWIEGLEQLTPAKLAKLPGTADGFATDAWLANWDSVGTGFDNLLSYRGAALRVDTGGALRYRAQGGLKGSAFGDDVPEFDSLRDRSANAYSGQVFGKLSARQLEDSVRRVLAIPEPEIRRLVDEFGPLDLLERQALADRLIARRRALAARYPDLEVAEPPAPVSTARITAEEQAAIVASRSNGYALRSDKGQIEDQAVIVHTFKGPDGKPRTRVWLKLRPEFARTWQSKLDLKGDQPGLELTAGQTVNGPLVELLRGINSRAAKGGTLEARSIERWQALSPRLDQAIAELSKAKGERGFVWNGDAEAALTSLTEWRGKLQGYFSTRTAASVAEALPIYQPIPESLRLALKGGAPKASTVPWNTRKGRFEYQVHQVERGNATASGGRAAGYGVRDWYERVDDGIEYRYVPYGKDNGYSTEGALWFDVAGDGLEATQRALAAIEKLGINASRAGLNDRIELFLDRYVYLATTKSPAKWKGYLELNKLDDAARLEAKRNAASQLLGKPIDQTDAYKQAEGVYQAFGHGRAMQLRPDLDTPEFREFEQGYVIYHNNLGLSSSGRRTGHWEGLKPVLQSGGHISSGVERVRRGIPPPSTSPDHDFRVGGGSYVFTRIQPRSSWENGVPKTTGLFFKPRLLRRLDAITYGGDKFGNVQESTLRSERYIDVKGFKTASRNSSNETIFRDSLSIFDDLELLVLNSRSEWLEAIRDLKAMGYDRWPDGRALGEVVTYVGRAPAPEGKP